LFGWELGCAATRSEGLFSYVRLEQRIAADHSLRAIRALVDAALAELSGDFDTLYAPDGRPSIPPERLLRAFAAAGVLHGAFGAAVDGTAGLQSVVPLVCRPGLGCDGVLQEPGSTARRRCRGRVLCCRAQAAAGAQAANSSPRSE